MRFDPGSVRFQFEYARWADGEVLRAASALPEEGYYRPQPISAGSVHKLLVHCMAAQWVWLCRWRGQDVRRLPDDQDYPMRQSLVERWPQVHAELFEFLGRQTAESLAAPLTYRNTRGQEYTLPLGGLMLHVADHSTYHRGQVNSMIKLAGGEPTPASLQLFLIRRSQEQREDDLPA